MFNLTHVQCVIAGPLVGCSPKLKFANDENAFQPRLQIKRCELIYCVCIVARQRRRGQGSIALQGLSMISFMTREMWVGERRENGKQMRMKGGADDESVR